MAQVNSPRGGVSASAWRRVLAGALSAMLVLSGCSTSYINDDATPLATTDEVAEEAVEGEEPQEGAAYSQTLEDGTVVSSDDMDVSSLDISVTATTEDEAEAASEPTPQSDAVPADDVAAAPEASTFSAAPAAVEAAPAAVAAEVTVGGFLVSGGTQGTDYKLSGTTVQVLTGTPLTFRNVDESKATNYNIQVNAGVHANITLAGVNIAGSASAPVNVVTNVYDTESGAKATSGSQIRNKTSLHLTLADGSVNVLNAGSVSNYAGLRCGAGSVLVIDDSRHNIDAAGNPVVPVNGLIGADVTLEDGTQLKAGDPLHKMDAANPGSLTCYGGPAGAGIGGGGCEDSGDITIEGGVIGAYGYQYSTQSDGNYNRGSAGIGGGTNGGGTVMTFNGGVITAHGAYHASGIGAGYGNQSYVFKNGAAPVADAIGHTSSVNKITATYAGEIYINGGFIKSTGGTHGNAFGQGCVSNNTNHIIKVTGGTLLPTSPSGYDIGGAGGYAIILGGSVRVASASKFQGNGNTAYNTQGITTWQDITDRGGSLPDSDKVEMVTIDLSGDINPSGDPNGGNNRIDYWELLVGNVPYNYGAPAQFDNGKLYLWLPKSATSQQITVNLKYRGDDNKTMEVEPLFREPNTPSGTLLKRYVDFQLDESYMSQLVKEYDGLPFDAYTIDADHPLQTPEIIGGTDENPVYRQLTNPDKVTYKYQRYSEREGTPIGAEVDTGKNMPADTGIMKFTMTSSEYASTKGFAESYWGHRATGWCEITPVPAVLTLESAEWGNLNEADGSWTPTTTADDAVGNRIRVSFNIRSAIGTKPTCKTPTGAVQLTIDGKPLGDPIQLTEEAVKASKWSTYEVTEGAKTAEENTEAAINSAENRWTAHIVYYMDPAQADGLLDAKPSKFKVTSKSDEAAAQETAGVLASVANALMGLTVDGQAFADEVNEDELGENEHKLSAEYLPDKNYVEGIEANPQNADATATIIIPVNSPLDITDDQGTKYEFEDVDPDDLPDGGGSTGGNDGPGGTPSGEDWGGTVKQTSIVKNYSDFHKTDANGNETIEKDYFTLNVKSDSAMPMTWVSSDPAVADLERDAEGNVVYDENGNPKVHVYSCGSVTITMHQPGNAVYNEQTRIIDMTVIPDQHLKPETEARVIWQNLTHPGLPAAPGDIIEYTVVGSNLTDGSAWQDVNLGDIVPGNVTVNPDSLEVVKNFESPEDLSAMTPEDLKNLPFQKAEDATVTKMPDGGTQVGVNVGSIYGGQSTALKFTVTVGDGIADRDSITGDNPPTIPNTPTASGSYGVLETQDLVPGTSEGDGTPIPVDDTKIIGIDADANPEAMVLPKDPTVGGNDSDIYVEKTAENLTRDGVVTLPGDTIRYAITVGNKAPDSCLYWPVIRDTLPVGVTPVPGSFVLTRVDGTQVPVADNVYVKATRTVALYVDDLFGGEATTLTFDCTVGADASMVENTAQVMGTLPSEKYLEEFPPPATDDPDGNDPDNPDGTDPDDPNGTDPTDPTDPDNPDGTDPTDPDGTDPTDPDGDKDDPNGPNGGDTPGGTDPDDPNKVTPPWPPIPGQPWTPDRETDTDDYPWDDFDWDEYVEKEGIPEVENPEPASPGVLIPATDPSLNGDLLIEKTAENLTNGNDGDAYVGDRIRYTITVTDTKPGSAWFDVIVRDNLPRGLEIDLSSAKVITAQGTEVPVAADAYHTGLRLLAVNVGDVPGGTSAALVFEAVITEEALTNDVGNVATAYGTLPSEVNPEDMEEGKRPTPGSGFKPNEGWDAYDRMHESLNLDKATYPTAAAEGNGIRPADESPALIAEREAGLDSGNGGAGSGSGDGWGTDLIGKYLRLAQTGDPLVMGMTTLVVLAAGAAILLVIARLRRKREE